MSGVALTRPPMSEKRLQAAIERTYQLAGVRVYHLSQPRNTMQSAGIPDCLCFVPALSRRWWHEVKTPTGRQSEAQRAFHAACEACGDTCLVGGMDVAEAHLIAIGLARRDGAAFVLTPQRSAWR